MLHVAELSEVSLGGALHGGMSAPSPIPVCLCDGESVVNHSGGSSDCSTTAAAVVVGDVHHLVCSLLRIGVWPSGCLAA
jgi:hypothetical protein